MDHMMYKEKVESTRNKVEITELINFDEDIRDIKVSIIVPVCNVEMYLFECLESIVSQTLKEIEIICVDDGSTDSSLSILKDFATRDKRVKIISKRNAGYGHTMNIGMDMAKGKYIGIVESDDYVDINMYEDLFNLAEQHMVDWIKADFNRFVNEDGNVKCTYNDVAKKKELYDKVINPSSEPYTFRFIMNTWSGIYNREFIVKNEIRHNETPGASFQDNGFWFQTMIYATRIYISSKPYYMNRRDNPNSSVFSKKKTDCIINEYQYIEKIISKSEEFKSKYIGELILKKYHNYKFHYNRIGDEDKLWFINTISKEFIEARDKGYIDYKLFWDYELDELNWIMENPVEYDNNHRDDSVKVSIIMPVYNAEKYLEKSIDSVLCQDLNTIELICIDDGSTDSSLQILEKYAQKDNRIIVLKQENLGGGAARNLGLKIAKGLYIAFLDADDFMEPFAMKEAFFRAVDVHADICAFMAKSYNETTYETKIIKDAFSIGTIQNKKFFSPKDLKKELFTAFKTWPWNKMFRRRFIENEGIVFQEIKRTNDLLFVCESMFKAKRLTALNKCLVTYRIGMNTNCQATNELSPTDFFEALMALKEKVYADNKYEFAEIPFKSLLVTSCIYNLNSMKNAISYRILYDYLHEIGFQNINVIEWEANDIIKEHKGYFNECLKIAKNTYEEYMFDKLIYYREKDKEYNVKKSRNKIEDSQKESQKIEISDMKKYVELIDNYSGQIIQLKDMCNSLQIQLLQTRTSFSCRIGLLITSPYRLIKRIISKSDKVKELV